MSSFTHTRPIVFVDADNTLWDTDTVYINAQLGLLANLESALNIKAVTDDRLGYVRDIDQDIAEERHEGLKYPPKLLILALEETLKGETGYTAHSELSLTRIEAIENEYLQYLRAIPSLRPGVLDGLKTLREAEVITAVVSDGNEHRIISMLEHFGIKNMMSSVFCHSKTVDFYKSAKAAIPASDNAYMIGDQLDVDIAAAQEAGLKTIYFPSAFRPKWLSAWDNIKPDHTVHSFDKAVEIVCGIT